MRVDEIVSTPTHRRASKIICDAVKARRTEQLRLEQMAANAASASARIQKEIDRLREELK